MTLRKKKPNYNNRPDYSRADGMFGRFTDAEIAGAIGCSSTAVAAYRKRNGIKQYKREKATPKKAEVRGLSIVAPPKTTDAALAALEDFCHLLGLDVVISVRTPTSFFKSTAKEAA